jgi:hypothetical protein
MKDLFESISEQGSPFSGFTCKEPLKYENSSWKILGKLDCGMYTAKNVNEIVEKSASMLPRSSFYPTSAVNDVIDGAETNIHMPTSTTPLGTSLANGWFVATIILLIILVLIIVIFVFIVSRIHKSRRHHEQLLENAGELLSRNDEKRVQDSDV